MVLRRGLPSRLTGAPPPEAMATPIGPAVPQEAPKISAPEPQTPPPAAPVAPPVEVKSDNAQVAAAATSAFGTLPTAPARVLEDSFQAAPAPAPIPEAQPVATPAPVVEAAPPAVVQPPVPQQPAPVSNLKPSLPDDNGMKRKVNRGSSPLPKATQPAPQPSMPAPEAPNLSEYQPSTPPVSATAEPAEAETSRRSRNKRPRDFAAATVPSKEQVKASPSEGTNRLAEMVPVTTRSLENVDEELIASGIIAGPAPDSLTSSVPVSMAVAESPFHAADHSAYAEEPKPLPAAAVSTPAPSLPVAPPTPVLPPVSTPLPEVRSELPWATQSDNANIGWEVEIPALPAETTQSLSRHAPPADFFKPATDSTAAATPPWASMPRGNVPAPEIHQGRSGRGTLSLHSSNTPMVGIGIGLVAAAVIAFFIWNNNREAGLEEKVARWTGALNENTEHLNTEGSLQPESTFSMSDLQPVPEAANGSTALLPPPAAVPDSTAQIDFADVPPEQAQGPIAADGTEQMPEDVSLFAKFQQAVASARTAKTDGTTPAEGAEAEAAPQMADLPADGKLTPEQLREELAAYRKSLVEAPSSQTAAKPNEFLKDPAAYMDGKPMDGAAVQPPAATPAENAQGQAGILPPPQLYTNNPSGLPVVGEPQANSAPRVRTLADFEVEPFEVEKEKVRVPRNLKPKMAATNFPSLEVLSFVPGRGVIAYVSGREGVLLIGETLEGWELTNVTDELAEFRAGQKRHYITVND